MLRQCSTTLQTLQQEITKVQSQHQSLCIWVCGGVAGSQWLVSEIVAVHMRSIGLVSPASPEVTRHDPAPAVKPPRSPRPENRREQRPESPRDKATQERWLDLQRRVPESSILLARLQPAQTQQKKAPQYRV